MQYDFSFENPTRIHFGKGSLRHLPQELSAFGTQVLLIYGGGSVKKTGLYDQVMDILQEAGKEVRELSGVPSNPTAAKVYEGIAIAREQSPDLILAVGGGSVIDCAKAVACGAKISGDFWNYLFLKRWEVDEAIPLGAVLTMAGTGSEMNGNAVVTNDESRLKLGMWSALAYPVFSILNPELTYTVPQGQMVSGICDVMSHILEIYMSPSDEDNLSDDLAEAILRNLIRNAKRAVLDPTDYTARSNIMWGATVALNGILDGAKKEDWMVHQIEHQIGAYTNCPHGLGLSAISATYYRKVLPAAPHRFYKFAVNVWGISPEGRDEKAVGMAGISAMEDFFREIGAAVCLKDIGMNERSPLRTIADSCRLLPGGYKELNHHDIYQILQESL